MSCMSSSSGWVAFAGRKTRAGFRSFPQLQLGRWTRASAITARQQANKVFRLRASAIQPRAPGQTQPENGPAMKSKHTTGQGCEGFRQFRKCAADLGSRRRQAGPSLGNVHLGMQAQGCESQAEPTCAMRSSSSSTAGGSAAAVPAASPPACPCSACGAALCISAAALAASSMCCLWWAAPFLPAQCSFWSAVRDEYLCVWVS